jgi:hypothetical protein
MDKQQREELLTQIEMFLGMGLLSLLAAAIYWGGNAQAGWGTMTDWIGRAISSLIIIVGMPFLLRKRKGAWFIVLAVLAATVTLWVVFAIASLGFSYKVFIGIFALFWVYSILLGIYYLWSSQTGRVSEWLDKMVNTAVFARQMVWSALLLVGTVTTWSDIRNHVPGFWPNIILIVGLLIVLLLMYGWVRGIWQDRRQDFRDHPE